MSTDDSSFKTGFGQRLKAARKGAGLNQGELAGWVGVSLGTLSRYERGELVPSAEVLAQLVLTLGDGDSTFTQWLMFGDLASANASPPFHVRSFGALTALRFLTGGMGVAEVSLGRSEVKRLLQVCVDYAERIGWQKESIEAAAEVFGQMLWACDEDEDAQHPPLDVIVDVPIAVGGVRLTPTPPGEGDQDLPISARGPLKRTALRDDGTEPDD